MNAGRKAAAGLAFAVIVACTGPSALAAAWVNTAWVEPGRPRPFDPLTIHAAGSKSTPCTPLLDAKLARQGTSLWLDVYFGVYDGMCIQVIAPWDLSEPLGGLPGGWYSLTVRTYSQAWREGGFSLNDRHETSFKVLPIPGDCDDDGDVDWLDFVSFKGTFATRECTAATGGDFDGDADVDVADYVVLKRSVHNASAPAAAVPEPATLLLVALGGAAVLRRRRRIRTP
jgi:hypothetical protein